jgi:DNA-binding MarR family transcriptional regulator
LFVNKQNLKTHHKPFKKQMDIGEIIHQKSFKSAHQKAVLNIMYTGGWLQLEQTQLLRFYEISAQQYNVLRILRGRTPAPATVAYIQERMLDRMSNASRLVDKLEVKELVTREPSKLDRRQTNIFITNKGLGMLQEMDVLIQGEETRFSHLTEDEAHQLSDLLDKLRG